MLSSPYEFPIDGATVRLLSAEDEVEGGRHYRTAATAVTDADGRFRLEALAAGRYLALVTHAAYDTLRNHAIDLETPGELTVFLARPGAAPSPDPRPSFGRVLDGEGRPLTETISSAWYQTKGTLVGRVLDGALPAAGAEVQLAGHAAVSTGADGGYVLSDLEPGTYTLEVRYQGAATTLPGVVVMAGRNEIDLRLADE